MKSMFANPAIGERSNGGLKCKCACNRMELSPANCRRVVHELQLRTLRCAMFIHFNSGRDPISIIAAAPEGESGTRPRPETRRVPHEKWRNSFPITVSGYEQMTAPYVPGGVGQRHEKAPKKRAKLYIQLTPALRDPVAV